MQLNHAVPVQAVDVENLDLAVCGGSLIASNVEKGCNVGMCSCMVLFGTCDASAECTSDGECFGQCRLSSWGQLFIYSIALLILLIPVLALTRQMILYRKREKQMTESEPVDEIDEGAIHEYRELDPGALGIDLSPGHAMKEIQNLFRTTDEPDQSEKTPAAVTVQLNSPAPSNTGFEKWTTPRATEEDIQGRETLKRNGNGLDCYIALEGFEKAQLGLVGIAEKPKIYLETITRVAHKGLLFYLFIVVLISITICTYTTEMTAQNWELSGATICDARDETSREFQCSQIGDQSASDASWHANFNLDGIERLSQLLRFQIDLRNATLSGLHPGLNRIAHYSISVASHGDSIAESFNGVLAVDCVCNTPPLSNAVCGGDGSFNCGFANLLSTRLREYHASYNYATSLISVSVVYTFFDQFSPGLFNTYHVQSFESIYSDFITYLYMVIAIVNSVMLSYYMYRMYRMNIPIQDHLLERKLLVFVLLCLFVQNNIVDWAITFTISVETGYIKFRQIWDTIAFGAVLGFTVTVVDGFRCRNREKNHLTSRFIFIKAVIFSLFFLARVAFSLTVGAQYLNLCDAFLISAGAGIFCIVAVKVKRYLVSQTYTETRHEQLAFRFLMLCFYLLISLLLLSVFSANPYERATSFQPTEQRNTYFASIFTLSCITYVIVLLYLPPAQDTDVAGYIFGEQRQFISTPRNSGSTTQKSTNRWRRLREHVRREVKPYWKPHGVFCVEAAGRLFNASRAAYYEPPNSVIDGPFGVCNMEALARDELRISHKITNESNDTHCLILEGRHRLILAFRGTSSKTNVKTDLAFKLVPVHEPTWPEACHVHRGFWNVYSSMRTEILESVRAILEARDTSDEMEYDCLQIYCTGHSLGGALATLTSLDLTVQLNREVVMYNYGSPKVGCRAFAEFYDSRVPKSFRVVNEGDVVCGQPTRLLPFSYLVAATYRHIGIEVVLDGRANGDVLVDPSLIEKNLYMNFQRKPTRHLMQSYKRSLDATVARVFDNETTEGHSSAGEEEVSPTRQFLHRGMFENTWKGTFRRLKVQENSIRQFATQINFLKAQDTQDLETEMEEIEAKC